MLRSVVHSVMTLLALAPVGTSAAPARGPVTPPARSAAPPPTGESAPSHSLAIDVRSAPLGSVVAHVAASGESPMRVQTALADRRVTLFAPKTDVAGFQHAIATLFRDR